MFLVVLRTPFFLPLGILSGSSSLVPYAGPLVTGAVLAVPVAAAAQIVRREVLAHRRTREGPGGPGVSPR